MMFLLGTCAPKTSGNGKKSRGGEMADALASGASDHKVMRVQVPPAAPDKSKSAHL